jgi:hypothetical protein
VVDGIAERLVDVPVHVGVEGNHLADGHSWLLVIASEAKQSSPSFRAAGLPRRCAPRNGEMQP